MQDEIGNEPGSFRDPSGQVFHHDGRIFRTIMPSASESFSQVRETGLLDALVSDGWLVPLEEIDANSANLAHLNPALVLEHPALPFVSYPYEWPFGVLKEAALHHLKVHLRALEHGVTLSDATAYNIQFDGGQPRFIDHLSFVPLREGEFWKGHRQFCEQFLNPLLLRAYLGVPHNAWYRGELEGIPTDNLNDLMPLRRKLSPRVLMHVTLPARFQRKFSDADSVGQINSARRASLPLATFRRMLEKLAAWIEGLAPRDSQTEWANYAEQNSYDDEAADLKRRYVETFVAESHCGMVWDLGCNTGDYSVAALDGGADYVVGFDVDQGALERGFARIREQNLNALPLFFDATNPAPQQGWNQAERKGMAERGPADGILALALTHHIAISGNVPLAQATEWLTSMGRHGIIEFVPKSDPMVKRLLQLREDIFPDYDEAHFLSELGKHAEVVDVTEVPNSDRKLVRFRTRCVRPTEADET